MAPLELDNNSVLINELLKAIRQLQITSAATSEALEATNVTLASLRASSVPSRNQSRGADKRLPFEIWEHISIFLYPSQIARLTRVSRTLYDLIAASIVWSRWFRTAFGPDVILDTLPATPESTSYMLYMCAVSGRVCEQCMIYSVPSRLVNDRAARPLPVLVPNSILRRRGHEQGSAMNNKSNVTTVPNESTSNGSDNTFFNNPIQGRSSSSLLQVTVVGEPINKTWSIRLCLPCRQIHYLQHPEVVPVHVLGKYRAYQVIHQTYNLTVHEINTLPSRVQLESFGYQSTVYSEEAAFKLSRHKHGGEVGIAVFNQPSLMVGQEQRTEDRIDAYRQR